MHFLSKTLWRRQEGATILEFALIAPVLFILIFGIIEFSLMMFVSSVIEGATANISRLAKTGDGRSTASNPTKRAEEDMARLRAMILERGNGIIRNNNLSLIVQPQSSAAGTVGGANELVVYTITYNWKIITPILSQVLGDDEGVFTIASMTAVVNEPFEE